MFSNEAPESRHIFIRAKPVPVIKYDEQDIPPSVSGWLAWPIGFAFGRLLDPGECPLQQLRMFYQFGFYGDLVSLALAAGCSERAPDAYVAMFDEVLHPKVFMVICCRRGDLNSKFACRVRRIVEDKSIVIPVIQREHTFYVGAIAIDPHGPSTKGEHLFVEGLRKAATKKSPLSCLSMFREESALVFDPRV